MCVCERVFVTRPKAGRIQSRTPQRIKGQTAETREIHWQTSYRSGVVFTRKPLANQRPKTRLASRALLATDDKRPRARSRRAQQAIDPPVQKRESQANHSCQVHGVAAHVRVRHKQVAEVAKVERFRTFTAPSPFRVLYSSFTRDRRPIQPPRATSRPSSARPRPRPQPFPPRALGSAASAPADGLPSSAGPVHFDWPRW